MLVLSACGENQRTPEEENILIYAALNPVTDKLEKSIARFNEKHEDVQIEIHDYSDEGGRERLQTELVLGQVPDIMELRCYGKAGEDVWDPLHGDPLPGSYTGPEDGYFMPYRQLAQRGYLEDLWPYIENDPDLGREAVLEAPLEAAEVNGGLYMLFERVEIFTLIGRASVVGDRYSWTLDDMMDAYAAMPEGSTIMRYNMTKREVFYNLLCNSLEGFVNRETGECTFDSEGFRSLVGLLETLPDEVDYEKAQEAEEEVMRRIKNGTQMLEGMLLYWPRNICRSDSIFQERAAFVGYPTADGSSGSFFYQTGTVLGMSSTCRNKAAAWDYIRQMITPRLRKTESSIIASDRSIDTPINLNDYEALCWYELYYMADTVRRYPEDPLKHYLPNRHFQYGPEIYLMDFLTEKDLQRHRELIDHTTQLYWPEDELSDIVWETLGAYFAGDRPLDDTIRLLESRVGLYLNENR
ncbi:MAG: extracellular solute-binding protein [Oscillibacter sp.]|nr:extracellular solute-binding protein [Oscillibacter sp.]